MRRGAIVRLVVLGIVLGLGATAVAIFIPWLPEASSTQAEEIDFVFWFVTAICIVVFAVVASIAVYSVLKFRAPPEDDSDGLPIHGHTGIEIVWTVVPFILVTAIGIVSAVALPARRTSPRTRWSSTSSAVSSPGSSSTRRATRPTPMRTSSSATPRVSPNRCISSGQLHLPVDVPVALRMRAADVIHSFWVPEFRQKQDLLPGQVRTIAITPTKIGEYEVLCTELCGLGHSVMRAGVTVTTQAEFDDWKREAAQQTGGGGNAGAAVFAQNGCGSCHALEEASATGTTGPSLEELPEQAERAGKPLEDFIRESIVEPDAYVEDGFTAGVMPKTYATLPDEQIDALVQYLVRSTEGGGSR